ncbi:MAG: DUF433 domain-containing protein [Acidobacteria bacterium]|nr:DUF433 domain-containing protein [Acidobacteriota bacterium]
MAARSRGRRALSGREASTRRLPFSDPAVHRDPEVLRGALVFVGTRVPFQTLLDYLEGGESLGRGPSAGHDGRRLRKSRGVTISTPR